MNTVPITILLLVVATALDAADPVGHRNDGSGFYPDAAPPVTWDDDGTNTAWKVDLGYWGNGDPVVVGDRIFVVNDLDWWDFDRIAPSLLCLDAADGSVVWERELDHTALLSPAKAAQVRADWLKLRRKYHQGWQVCAEVAAELGPGKRATAVANERLEALDMALGKPLTVFNLKVRDRAYRDLDKKLRQYNLWSLSWSQPVGQWCGVAYPTPVSDGEHIWVRTGFATAFCFDLEGDQRWATVYLPGRKASKQSWCVSPVLADGVLVIADAQNQHGFDAVGLDAKTGRERWRVEPWQHWVGYPLGDCQVLEVDGKPVVVLPSGRIIRPADGKVLAEGVGRVENTCTTGAGDLLITHFRGLKKRGKDLEQAHPWLPPAEAEASLVAFRLAWDGPDRLAPTPVWHCDFAKGNPLARTSPVLAHGLVFQVVGRNGGGPIIAVDATTGEVVGRADDRSFGRPRHGWNLSVAGDKLYAIDYKKGTVAVLSADRELEVLAVNPAIGRPQSAVPKPWGTWRIGANKHDKPWGPALSQSLPLTFAGDRLYLRAWRHLYCFEN